MLLMEVFWGTLFTIDSLCACFGGQASAVFEHPVGSGQMLWLGNQWASGGGAVRNSDLLYWSLLRFGAAGDVLQFTWCALFAFAILWLAVCATAAVTGGKERSDGC